VSQSSEFCCHNPLCCFLTSVYCCCSFVIDSVRKLLDTLVECLDSRCIRIQEGRSKSVYKAVNHGCGQHIIFYTVRMENVTLVIPEDNFKFLSTDVNTPLLQLPFQCCFQIVIGVASALETAVKRSHTTHPLSLSITHTTAMRNSTHHRLTNSHSNQNLEGSCTNNKRHQAV
jgi:hypothetical protein